MILLIKPKYSFCKLDRDCFSRTARARRKLREMHGDRARASLAHWPGSLRGRWHSLHFSLSRRAENDMEQAADGQILDACGDKDCTVGATKCSPVRMMLI
jgi:hypothetical protein